jgi:hypothetical protein
MVSGKLVSSNAYCKDKSTYCTMPSDGPALYYITIYNPLSYVPSPGGDTCVFGIDDSKNDSAVLWQSWDLQHSYYLVLKP